MLCPRLFDSPCPNFVVALAGLACLVVPYASRVCAGAGSRRLWTIAIKLAWLPGATFIQLYRIEPSTEC
ncbi:hypothetical protein GQ53DRAFT_751756 [Thozetella sp. PMI_491]|nr:hypothetical protein GQ53DRAFT_751756 [Thozetella sp. PMI_491]